MVAIGTLLRAPWFLVRGIEYTAKCGCGSLRGRQWTDCDLSTAGGGRGDGEDASDVVLRVQPPRGVRPRRLGGCSDDRLRVDAAGAVAGHGGGARARQVRSDHARR